MTVIQLRRFRLTYSVGEASGVAFKAALTPEAAVERLRVEHPKAVVTDVRPDDAEPVLYERGAVSW